MGGAFFVWSPVDDACASGAPPPSGGPRWDPCGRRGRGFVAVLAPFASHGMPRLGRRMRGFVAVLAPARVAMEPSAGAAYTDSSRLRSLPVIFSIYGRCIRGFVAFMAPERVVAESFRGRRVHGSLPLKRLHSRGYGIFLRLLCTRICGKNATFYIYELLVHHSRYQTPQQSRKCGGLIWENMEDGGRIKGRAALWTPDNGHFLHERVLKKDGVFRAIGGLYTEFISAKKWR